MGPGGTDTLGKELMVQEEKNSEKNRIPGWNTHSNWWGLKTEHQIQSSVRADPTKCTKLATYAAIGESCK